MTDVPGMSLLNVPSEVKTKGNLLLMYPIYTLLQSRDQYNSNIQTKYFRR